jgi:hypothetical protein
MFIYFITLFLGYLTESITLFLQMQDTSYFIVAVAIHSKRRTEKEASE